MLWRRYEPRSGLAVMERGGSSDAVFVSKEGVVLLLQRLGRTNLQWM